VEVSNLPRNKYPEETVKKILDVSLKLFIEKGFEKTTILDIVDNLGGLTRGAFYHHFKSKEEVLDAILAKNYDDSNPFEKAKSANMPNGLERLKHALFLGLNTNIASEWHVAVTTLAVSLLSNPRFLAEHIKGIQEHAKDMAVIMQEGMADGSIKQGNPKIVSELFLLLANAWMMPSIFPPENKDEMLAKIEMVGEIFDKLGYHFLDDELGELFYSILDDFEI